MNQSLACAIGLLLSFSNFSEVLADDTVTVEKFRPAYMAVKGSQTFLYRSYEMDRDYEISVKLPARYNKDGNKAFPALVVTDGHDLFPAAAGIHGMFEGGEAVKDMFIIGVGAPKSADNASIRRMFEFSPPDWNLDHAFGKNIARFCASNNLPVNKCTGGAPRFHSFLATELLPDLLQSYRIDENDLGLFGWSAGGFFATYALFQETTPFSKFIVASPAYVFGDGEVFRLENQWAEANSDLSAQVYISSGGLEMTDGFIEGTVRIASGQLHLSGKLNSRGYKGLTLHSELHEGLGHEDALFATMARGMRTLFKK